MEPRQRYNHNNITVGRGGLGSNLVAHCSGVSVMKGMSGSVSMSKGES